MLACKSYYLLADNSSCYSAVIFMRAARLCLKRKYEKKKNETQEKRNRRKKKKKQASKEKRKKKRGIKNGLHISSRKMKMGERKQRARCKSNFTRRKKKRKKCPHTRRFRVWFFFSSFIISTRIAEQCYRYLPRTLQTGKKKKKNMWRAEEEEHIQ